MAIRYISKGKGKNKKSFPIRPKKKGVSVRSVSLQPSAVVKVNKEQIKLLNRGEPATFSKALNQVIIRAKRDGIPIYDTHVNSNDRRKPYHMWIVKHPEKGDKVKGSDTIVMAEHYGQAIDDFITIWNKEKRKKITIGYPQVQGTAEKSFRYARSEFLNDITFRVEKDKTFGKREIFSPSFGSAMKTFQEEGADRIVNQRTGEVLTREQLESEKEELKKRDS